jgi:hypothetical protein
MKFLEFFQFFWIIHAFVDLDPDSGSGSTEPIKSGSYLDPKTLISVGPFLLGALAFCSLLMGGGF